ncbi:flagellar export protein FliJ [Proteinivorax hydrogeniformans]|uniref:Flagellar FliJ protein n=1 Tax=Proteinivorax hydrogeniformans TaxID=1826727 RepID=A0AAU8HPR0_9FIRM
MKGFNFSLQKVLEYKETLLNEEISKIQDKLSKINKTQQDIESVGLRKTQVVKATNEKCSQGITVENFSCHSKYFSFLHDTEKRLYTIQSKQKEQLDNLKNIAQMRQKEKKTLEKLKEKKLKEFGYNLKKQEQNFIDDIVSARH